MDHDRYSGATSSKGARGGEGLWAVKEPNGGHDLKLTLDTWVADEEQKKGLCVFHGSLWVSLLKGASLTFLKGAICKKWETLT